MKKCFIGKDNSNCKENRKSKDGMKKNSVVRTRNAAIVKKCNSVRIRSGSAAMKKTVGAERKKTVPVQMPVPGKRKRVTENMRKENASDGKSWYRTGSAESRSMLSGGQQVCSAKDAPMWGIAV